MSLLITELVNTQSGDIGCLAKKKNNPLALQAAAASPLAQSSPFPGMLCRTWALSAQGCLRPAAAPAHPHVGLSVHPHTDQTG